MTGVYKSIIGSIHNFSKYEYLFKIEWRNLNQFDGLLNAAKLFEDFEIVLLSYFGLIKFIQYETNLPRLNDLNQVVDVVVCLLSECTKMIALNPNIERKPFKIDLQDEDIKQILVVKYKQAIFRLTELVYFLDCVADIDEKYKLEIYENSGLKWCINVLLFNGNDIEKEYLIKLLWKLCKDQRVSQSIRSDINLYSYLIGISKNEYVKNKTLLKFSNLILFLIENNLNNSNYNSVGRKSLKSLKSNSAAKKINLENLFDSIRI